MSAILVFSCAKKGCFIISVDHCRRRRKEARYVLEKIGASNDSRSHSHSLSLMRKIRLEKLGKAFSRTFLFSFAVVFFDHGVCNAIKSCTEKVLGVKRDMSYEAEHQFEKRTPNTYCNEISLVCSCTWCNGKWMEPLVTIAVLLLLWSQWQAWGAALPLSLVKMFSSLVNHSSV